MFITCNLKRENFLNFLADKLIYLRLNRVFIIWLVAQMIAVEPPIDVETFDPTFSASGFSATGVNDGSSFGEIKGV